MADDNMIQRIELKLGETTISLTLEQAKRLKAALGELFQKEVVREVVRERGYWPWYWGYSPYDPLWHNTQTAPVPGQVYYLSNGTSASFSKGTLSLAVQR